MADENDPKNDHDSPANPDNQIGLQRVAADREHEQKLTGEIPPRSEPDRPEAPRAKTRGRGRHGVALKETPSTGHEWDGIKEYDNPLPRWWLWTFYVTIVWAIGYMVFYPALPLANGNTQGLLGYTNRNQVAAEIKRFDDANAAVQQKLAEVDLAAIQSDPELSGYAVNAGGAIFRTWCAQCHGAGAGGARGYPNLADDDWLWGGTIDDIHTTVQHGIRDPKDGDTRFSEMPRFGTDGLLDGTQIGQVVNYVLSLSGQPHDAARAAEGQQLFVDNCAACHAEDGTGDRAQGAPNLADAVWLYGNDPATVTRIVTEGPFGVMPSWTGRLSEAEIRAVASYVHQLGGGE